MNTKNDFPNVTTTSDEFSTGVRLNKALADAGICSRRKADAIISQGLVSVNGQTVTSLGMRVMPQDVVTVNGVPLPSKEARTYLVMHKPIQVLCTAKDPEGRPTVLDLLPAPWNALRLYPVGRLDYFSEGLIILTDDGELAHKLAHPRHHLPKVYQVLVREDVSEEMLEAMRTGMLLAEGEQLASMEVEILPPPASARGTLLQMTLHQGINRQIRRMCRDVHLTILTLTRVAQGPLQLGELPSGKVRVLSDIEVQSLRNALE
ncbi:MAG: pseudouridine synthase [Desulfovibrionaceae bacterium]